MTSPAGGAPRRRSHRDAEFARPRPRGRLLGHVRHARRRPAARRWRRRARDQAEVIAKAIHDGLEQGDHVTSDQFKAGLAEVRAEIAALDTRLSTQISDVRTEIANLETRLIRWMVGTVIATATLTVGILRLIG